jgi:hypothetical protein
MSKRARSADGVIHEFPDDADDATIDRAMQEYAQGVQQQPSQQEAARDPLVMQGLGKFTEGLAGLPGAPVDLVAAADNFVRRQFDMPEYTSYRGGSADVSDAVMGAAGIPKVAAPINDTERLVQKTGLFFGGSVPFGPAGLVPTAGALVGSEVGRAADQAAPEFTKGYGETIGAIGGGVAGSIRRQPVRTPAPTEAQIYAAKNAAYQAAERAGLIYTPSFMQRLGQQVRQDLAGYAFDDVMHPLVARVVARLDDRAQSNVTLADVDNLRQLAGNAGESLLPKERMLASRIIERIDDAIDNPQTGEVLVGDAAGGAAAIREARALNSRLAKMRRAGDAAHNAEVAAETAHAGGNIDNTLRQHFKPMLRRGGRAGVHNRGWTADERAMLRRVTRGGGPVHQIARQLGRMSPERGGLMQAIWGTLGVGTGLGTGGASLPLVAAGAGGTAAAKRIADAMTRAHVQDLMDTIARGGQGFQPRTPQRLLTRAGAAVPGAVQSREDRR